jgi:hypothetical protein
MLTAMPLQNLVAISQRLSFTVSWQFLFSCYADLLRFDGIFLWLAIYV